MISHSYLLLGAAGVWIAINFLGAGFTIRRNHLREKASKAQIASHGRAVTQH
jgi:uncharacterized membrane protein SpoIIM required for sporulation